MTRRIIIFVTAIAIFAIGAAVAAGCSGAEKKAKAPVGPKPFPKMRKPPKLPSAERKPLPGEADDGTFYTEPLKDVPYILGAGDKIIVRIEEAPHLEQELVVSVAGTILPKRLAPVKAADKTIQELETDLTTEYKRLIHEPHLSVGLKSGRPRYIFIAGSLARSGRLTISGQPSLLEVLTLAGWTEDSPVRSVTVVRGEKYKSVNLEYVLTGKKLGDNIIVKEQDLIIAAKDFPITVTGAVKKPGKYNLDGATHRSIAWVIAKAHGIQPDASLAAARIIGKDGSERLVDLNPILFGDVNEKIDFISPGETLYIPISKKIRIYVLGMVNQPGQFVVDDGITVTQAIALADSERFGAVLSAATLITGYFSGRPESITFNLADALEGNTDLNYRMDDGSVLFIPESTTSDVLDFLNRLLSPLSGTMSVAVQAQDLSESGTEDK